MNHPENENGKYSGYLNAYGPPASLFFGPK